MIIDVKDNWAVITKDDTIQQNSPKTYWVHFNFDKTWDGYSRTVEFEVGPAHVLVVLKEYSEAENLCEVPKECIKHSGKLKIGIYGVKGDDRKVIAGYLTSMILPDGGMNNGSSSATTSQDKLYSEIMAAIGDLNAAGFEGKSLAEVFREIRDHVCETATDDEVADALNTAFGTKTDPSELPEEHPDNTATDKEVSDLLDEVFGK